MRITPTPITAALAGVFSAITWPMLWSRFGNTASAGSLELVLATLLLIALPTHVFVVGFARDRSLDGKALDTALLKRFGVWLLAAAATVAVGMVFRNQPG